MKSNSHCFTLRNLGKFTSTAPGNNPELSTQTVQTLGPFFRLENVCIKLEKKCWEIAYIMSEDPNSSTESEAVKSLKCFPADLSPR